MYLDVEISYGTRKHRPLGRRQQITRQRLQRKQLIQKVLD